MLSSSEFFSCQAHKSFSTHQHSHLTLMAPSAVLSDSIWSNTETLVTVKGFKPGCFSTDSRGTCPDIPGILRWIALFPGSTVDYGTEERTEPDLLKIYPKPSHVLFLWQFNVKPWPSLRNVFWSSSIDNIVDVRSDKHKVRLGHHPLLTISEGWKLKTLLDYMLDYSYVSALGESHKYW